MPSPEGPRTHRGRPPEATRADPDAVMAEVNRPRMGRMLAFSTVFHFAVIGLTSVSFIGLCFKHNTLHPKWAIKQLQKEEAEKQAAAEAAKSAEEAKKRVGSKAGVIGKATAPSEPRREGAPSSASSPGGQPAKSAGDKKSTMEKELTEVAKDRPTDSSVNLDELK